jgi:hypothetical protein
MIITDFWWLFVAAGGLVAGAVVFMVVLVMREKDPAAQPAKQPVPPSADAELQLICLGGHYAGKTFPLRGPVSVGRDPQLCHIIFPSGTNGISALHCEISPRPGGVTLTDKGSTYGTFLSGGRKLGENQSAALNPGDSFYLAESVNEFKVMKQSDVYAN